MGRLARLPILMIVLGFGSLILKQFNYHFTLLVWADDYQPAAGAIIGLLGVVILLLMVARARARNAPAEPAAGYGPPMQPGGPAGPNGPAGPAGPAVPGGQAGPPR